MKAYMLKNVYEDLNAQKCILRLKSVNIQRVFFGKMYTTCMSSKLCKFILLKNKHRLHFQQII